MTNKLSFEKITIVTEAGIEIDSRFPYHLEKNILLDVFPSLAGEIEDDGLFELNSIARDFEFIGKPGFSNLGYLKSKTTEYTIMMNQALRKSSSRINSFNNNLLYYLFFLYNNGSDCRIKVALDLDCIMLSKDWHEVCERERIYGAPFTQEIPHNKIGPASYSSNIDKLSTLSESTQFFWKNNKDQTFQLEAEEVRSIDFPDQNKNYPCKYLHTMYNLKDCIFEHLDGAIRTYDFQKMNTRLSGSLGKCIECDSYEKAFRVDGKIPIDIWKSIISNFFLYNSAVVEYLNGQ